MDVGQLRRRAVDLLNLAHRYTVVDLECGVGLSLPLLAGAVGENWRVAGVDVPPRILQGSRRRTSAVCCARWSFRPKLRDPQYLAKDC